VIVADSQHDAGEGPGAAPARTRGPERRRGTVLYADITGSTALSERRDPEELYEIVGGCLKLLERTATEYGSGLVKSRGDGVLAVFGLPTAIETPVHAAVNAAIEMRNRVADYARRLRLDPPLQLHTGINTGLMIAGDVSTALNPEVDVLGDAVNVAARLSGQAPPGSIYAGEESWRATAEDFHYGQVRRLKLRGKSSSVAAYEVLSARSSLHRPTAATLPAGASPLVGRRPELETLERCVGALVAGRGGVASLVGEAGLGKSRLVAELSAEAEEQGVAWAEGRCLAIGRNLRFHPFADLLRSWWDIRDGEPERSPEVQLEARLRALVPERGEEILPFLASLMGIPVSAERAERARSVQGEALERLTQMSVRLVLSEAARQKPLVLVFEDLHWADQTSMELLGSLLPLAQREPILFIWVARPDSTGAGEALEKVVEANGRIAYTPLRLSALSSEECEHLLADLLPDRALPRPVRRRIVEKSAGNPFFLEEVAFSLIDQGALVHERDGLASTDRIADLRIPDRVQDVILTRIDRLDPARRELLQVSSVIGTAFSLPVLTEVTGAPGTLDDDLAALVDSGFLARGGRGEATEFSFRHPMIRDVVYESLLLARRKQLHGLVARSIERHLAPSIPGYFALLAFHATLAEDLDRAEEFLFRAGEEAAQTAATSEALHFFQEASRVFLARSGGEGDPEKRALLEKKVALSLFYRGHFAEALEHFNRWLGMLGEKVPRGRLRTAMRLLAGTGVIVREAFRPPSHRPEATDRQREIIAMMFDRARAQTTAAPERFLIDTLENFRQLGRVDPASVPGAGGMVASGGLGIFGFSGISFAMSRRLLDVAAGLVDESDPRELFLFRSMSYYHHVFEGDWDTRHEIDDDLVEAALSKGELWDVVTYLGVDGRKKVHQGRFEEASAVIERLAGIEELYAYDLARSSRQADTALLKVERGHHDAALVAAERYHRDTEEELLNLIALGLKAKVRAQLGDNGGARQELDLATAIVERTRLLPPFHRSAWARSKLLVELVELEAAQAAGDAGGARRLRSEAGRSARRAARIAKRVSWERTEIARLVGRYHWLCGRADTALEWWGRSIASGRALGARPELARTCLEIDRRLSERADREWDLLGAGPAAYRREGERLAAELGLDGSPVSLAQEA